MSRWTFAAPFLLIAAYAVGSLFFKRTPKLPPKRGTPSETTISRRHLNPFLRIGIAFFFAGIGCAFLGRDPFVPYMIGIGILIIVCAATMQPPAKRYYYDEKGRRRFGGYHYDDPSW